MYFSKFNPSIQLSSSWPLFSRGPGRLPAAAGPARPTCRRPRKVTSYQWPPAGLTQPDKHHKITHRGSLSQAATVTILQPAVQEAGGPQAPHHLGLDWPGAGFKWTGARDLAATGGCGWSFPSAGLQSAQLGHRARPTQPWGVRPKWPPIFCP